jgi:hypothetical protein
VSSDRLKLVRSKRMAVLTASVGARVRKLKHDANQPLELTRSGDGRPLRHIKDVVERRPRVCTKQDDHSSRGNTHHRSEPRMYARTVGSACLVPVVPTRGSQVREVKPPALV